MGVGIVSVFTSQMGFLRDEELVLFCVVPKPGKGGICGSHGRRMNYYRMLGRMFSYKAEDLLSTQTIDLKKKGRQDYLFS